MIQKPTRSGIVRKAGMEAWTTGPSVQAALRGKLRKDARESGEPGRGGREPAELEEHRKPAVCQLH